MAPGSFEWSLHPSTTGHGQSPPLVAPPRLVPTRVGREPVERVERDDSELVGNDFRGKVHATLENVTVLAGDEVLPDPERGVSTTTGRVAAVTIVTYLTNSSVILLGPGDSTLCG
jgi:hypothetical protein